MINFVQSGGFTKVIAIIVIALMTVGSGILLGIVLINNVPVNTSALVAIGGMVGSGMTYFTKASGIVDGATVASNAVVGVTNAIQASSSGASPVTVPVTPQVPVSTPVQG